MSDPYSDDEEVSISTVRNADVTRSPSHEELLPLLECPVCFELPLPPIRTCYQGHIICADCCSKLSACPLCQKPIGYGRNFFAEDFINRSIMECMYKSEGCLLSLTGESIKKHSLECLYRPLKCEVCLSIVPYRDYESHLILQHHFAEWDINDEGERVMYLAKARRTGTQYTTPNMNIISTSLFVKSLLALAAVSVLVDQIIFAFSDPSSNNNN